ncbi:Protein ECERIFERUM 2 [Linum grandiflorum]
MASTPPPAVSAARLSSVVPASVTGEQNKDWHLSGLDLAMKLHYIKAVYFFSEEAVRGFTISELKKPMFPWLALYYPASGRIRRPEKEDEGRRRRRPFIRCNDGGVRIGEAHCADWTVEEWLRRPPPRDEEEEEEERGGLLSFDHVLGPDLGFSPLVYIQFTWFKCGGLSVGLSWSHVLGDPFSASTFINTWAQLLNGHNIIPDGLDPYRPISFAIHGSPAKNQNPSVIKRVDPVGDCWRYNNGKTETHTFRLTSEQLNTVISRVTTSSSSNVSSFDILSAIIWKSLTKLRDIDTVTICRNKVPAGRRRLGNKMAVAAVHAGSMGEVCELAELIAVGGKEDESELIEEKMKAAAEEEDGVDCVVYGAKLTFVNMEEAEVYGMEMKGRKPIWAEYRMEGVGEEGCVLVMKDEGLCGRAVTVMLPAKEVAELKEEMWKNWGIV